MTIFVHLHPEKKNQKTQIKITSKQFKSLNYANSGRILAADRSGSRFVHRAGFTLHDSVFQNLGNDQQHHQDQKACSGSWQSFGGSALFGSKEKTLEILQEEFTEHAVAKYEEYAEETEYKGLEGFQKKMKYWADKYTSSATYLGCPYDFNTALTDLFNKIRVCKEDYPLPKEKGM